MLRTAHLGIRWLEESTLLNICTTGTTGGVLWPPFQDVGQRAGQLPPTSPAGSGALQRADTEFGRRQWLRAGQFAYSIPRREGGRLLEHGAGVALRGSVSQMRAGWFLGDALQGQPRIARPTAAQPALPGPRSDPCRGWFLWPPSHSGCPACHRPRPVPTRSAPGLAGPPAQGGRPNGQ